MRKINFTILTLLLFTAVVHAQGRVVTGVVTDERGNPVEAAAVKAIGVKFGTTTNEIGEYRLTNVPPNATLRFYGVGITTKEVNAGISGPVNITVAKEVSYIHPITVLTNIIYGVVTDPNGHPLEGVSVRVNGTRASTGTDSLGRYRIYAASDTLVFETRNAWPVKEKINRRRVINTMISILPPPEPDEVSGAAPRKKEHLIHW